MIVDGKALAEELKTEIKNQAATLLRVPVLAIVLVGDNPMSVKYTNLKKTLGESLGIKVVLHSLLKEATTDEVKNLINQLSSDNQVDGLIVQLPLPEQVDRGEVVGTISIAKDVDALTTKAVVLSPVVEAIKYILTKNNLANLTGKKVVVVGRGSLVGLPVATWVHGQADVDLQIIDTQTPAELRQKLLAEADYIVSGAGIPGLIKPDDIKEGVVLIDASTSDVNGKTVGDIDSACAAKASLFTPVPGGVGPLTVVMLFQNLLTLVKK